MLGEDGTTRNCHGVEQAGEIGAVVGSDGCPDVTGTAAAASPTSTPSRPREVYVSASHGTAAYLGDSPIRVVDVSSSDQLMGLVSVDDLGSCSAVFREPIRRRCGRPATTR